MGISQQFYMASFEVFMEPKTSDGKLNVVQEDQKDICSF